MDVSQGKVATKRRTIRLERHMNDALNQLAKDLGLPIRAAAIGLEFGHACARRVSHLLEESEVEQCLLELGLPCHTGDRESLARLAANARLANHHKARSPSTVRSRRSVGNLCRGQGHRGQGARGCKLCGIRRRLCPRWLRGSCRSRVIQAPNLNGSSAHSRARQPGSAYGNATGPFRRRDVRSRLRPLAAVADVERQ